MKTPVKFFCEFCGEIGEKELSEHHLKCSGDVTFEESEPKRFKLRQSLRARAPELFKKMREVVEKANI